MGLVSSRPYRSCGRAIPAAPETLRPFGNRKRGIMTCKRLSLAVALSVLTLTSAYAQDNWNGGTGKWSNGSDWSAGLPGAGSDVVIYSGGNDTVTLDTSATINSLTLGGANNGFTSELTDGGVAQTLTITNGLTVGQTGFLNLLGSSTVSAG